MGPWPRLPVGCVTGPRPIPFLWALKSALVGAGGEVDVGCLHGRLKPSVRRRDSADTHFPARLFKDPPRQKYPARHLLGLRATGSVAFPSPRGKGPVRAQYHITQSINQLGRVPAQNQMRNQPGNHIIWHQVSRI